MVLQTNDVHFYNSAIQQEAAAKKASVSVYVLPAVPLCLMVFLATSASAPIPKPTAKPSAKTQTDPQLENIIKTQMYQCTLQCNRTLKVLKCCKIVIVSNVTKTGQT